MKMQRGFIQFPTAGELAGCFGVIAAIFIGLGVLLGWAAPIVWGWIKPWIHAVTA